MNGISEIFWLFVILSSVAPMFQRWMMQMTRMRIIEHLGRKRGSRMITLIHRQETMSFLGFPLSRYIDIDDSEMVLQAIRLTPAETPIDMVLHTPGGLVLAAEQIALALAEHPGKVTVMVPHYAMSGGTLIALAADEVIMDEHAVLGPVDPQIGNYAAASILRAAAIPNPNRDDQTLILADLAEKAIHQVEDSVFDLVRGRMGDAKGRELARTLSEGRWTHDYPLTAKGAGCLGIPVRTGLPPEVYDLMRLYPQSGARRPSVEYVPVPLGPAPQDGARRPPRHGLGASSNV